MRDLQVYFHLHIYIPYHVHLCNVSLNFIRFSFYFAKLKTKMHQIAGVFIECKWWDFLFLMHLMNTGAAGD